MSLDFDDDFLSHDGDSESGDENSPHCLEEVGSPSSSKANSCKAKYKHVPHCEKPPQVVEKRNARERKRVQTVNGAFVRLRKFIPYENRHKRLSKVKTLRKAIEYIDHLQAMLGQDFEGSSTASTPPPPMPSSQAPSVYTGHEDLSTNPMRLPLQLPQENQSVSLMFGQAMSSDNLTSAAEHCYKAPHAFTQMLSSEYHELNAPTALNNNNNNIIHSSCPGGVGPVHAPSSQSFFGLLPASLAEASTTEYPSYLPQLLQTLPPSS